MTPPPATSAPPIVAASPVAAVITAPVEVDPAIPATNSSGSATPSVVPVDVVRMLRRVETCESRLALMYPSPQYWPLRCECLERELGDSRALVSRLDGKLRHEMALTDHWRRQVEF